MDCNAFPISREAEVSSVHNMTIRMKVAMSTATMMNPDRYLATKSKMFSILRSPCLFLIKGLALDRMPVAPVTW